MSADPARPEKRRGPVRRILRWMVRIAAFVFVLLLVARASLGLWLPKVVNGVTHGRGLHVSWEDLDLSILGLSGELIGVRAVALADETGSERTEDELAGAAPVARLDEVGFDVDVSALLFGTIRVHRVEVSGLEAWLTRDADGRWNVEDFAGPEGDAAVEDEPDATADAEEAEDAGGEPAPIDFTPPLELTSLAISAVRLHLDDAVAGIETTLRFDALVRDVAADDRPAEVLVTADAAGILDGLRLEAHGLGDGPRLTLDVDLHLGGLAIGRLGPYLEPLGLRPAARELDAGLVARIDLDALETEGDEAQRAARGTLELTDVELIADGEIAVGLDALRSELSRLAPLAIEVETITVTGTEAHAERLADGTLRVAGLDLVGAPADGDDDDADSDTEPDPDPTPGTSPVVRIADVSVEPVTVTFVDHAAPGGASVEHALSVSANVVDIALGGPKPSPFTARLDLSLADTAHITVESDVQLPAEDGSFGADVRVEADALTLERLAPYLAGAGLETTLGADASLGLTASVLSSGGETPRLDALLSDLRLRSADATLLGLEGLRIKGLTRTDEGTTLDEFTVRGTVVPVELLEGGGFRGFGVVTAGRSDAPGRLVGLEGGRLTVRDLAFGGSESTASIEGTLDPIALARALDVSGSVVTRSEPFDLVADITIGADTVDLEALAPALDAAGFEATLHEGAFGLSLRAHARAAEGDATLVDAEVLDLALTTPEDERLVSLERLALEEYRIGGPGDLAQTGRVLLRGLDLRVGRDADGALLLAGLRQAARAATPTGDEVAAAAEGSAPPPTSTASPAEPDVAPADGTPPPAPLAALVLEGVRVQWSDAALEDPVELELTLGGALEWSGTAASTRLGGRLDVGIPGVVETIALVPEFVQRTDSLDANARIDVTGIDVGLAAGYLPPTIRSRFEAGTFGLAARVHTEPAAEGGIAVRAQLEDLALRRTPDEEPALQLEALRVDVPRIDGAAKVYEIGRVDSEGLVATLEKMRDGGATRIDAFGIALVPGPAPAPGTGAPSVEDPVTEVPEPTGESVVPGAPTKLGETPPTVVLGALDLGIDRIRYVDRTRENAEPLDLTLHLTTPGAQTLLAKDLESLEPVRLSLGGAVSPLVANVRAELEVEPFAADLRAVLDLALEGIDGAALTRVDPDLTRSVDPAEWKNGSVTLHTDTVLTVPRRGAYAFAPERGISGRTEIGPLALRPTLDAEPTGFESLLVELKRVVPSEGDVHIGTVDLQGVRAHAVKSADGTRVAGLLLRESAAANVSDEPLGPPAPEGLLPPADGPGNAADEGFEDAPTELARDDAPAPDASEVRIDSLTVGGVDVSFRDTTVQPEFVMPIEDVSLEVQRFTTRTFDEGRPFSFRLLVDAGKVELPERTGADNLLFGVLGSVAQAATFSSAEYETEERRVWDLLEVTGRMALGPTVTGRVQTTLLGLELPAFRGPAAQGGVEIGDGLVDTRSTVRFRQDGGLSIDSRTTATYLSLSEPPNGPISKYLSLPAPLDTVLFLLRNDDGAQVLPIRLDVPSSGVSAGRVASLAAETLGLLITDAVSSAPLRVLGPLGEVAGALGFGSTPPTGETVTLAFAGGAATLAASERADEEAPSGTEPLAKLADALRRNTDLRVVVQATIGADDVEVARRIGNPPRETLEALIAKKREQKAVLRRARAELAARTRALLSVGDTEGAAEATDALRLLDVERAKLEASLDGLFERTRAGAERRAEMRTRVAAVGLARERQARVRAALLELAGPAAADRVDVRRPRYQPPTDEDPLPRRGTVTLTPK